MRHPILDLKRTAGAGAALAFAILALACGVPVDQPTRSPVADATPTQPTASKTESPSDRGEQTAMASPTPEQVAQPACEPTSSPDPDPPPPATYFDGRITLELVAPSHVCIDEHLTGMDMLITNNSNEEFVFGYSGNLVDYEVLDETGEVIWNQLYAWPEPLLTFELPPGETKRISSLRFGASGEWDLRDMGGLPIAPGQYQVRGVLNVELQEGQRWSGVRLETAVHPVTVEAAGRREYAQPIELELVAPDEVVTGEPVPLDLRISNAGNEPVVLWWGNDYSIPRFIYMDIVVSDGDEVIWRVSTASGFPSQGHLTMQPGESTTMSSFTLESSRHTYEGTGEPWLWDQRPDFGPGLGDFGFDPDHETPVQPGTYTVQAVVNVSSSETLERIKNGETFMPERIAIATERHELVIAPSDG